MNMVPKVNAYAKLLELLLVCLLLLWGAMLPWLLGGQSLYLVPPIRWNMYAIARLQDHVHHFQVIHVLLLVFRQSDVLKTKVIWDVNLLVPRPIWRRHYKWLSCLHGKPLERRHQGHFFSEA